VGASVLGLYCHELEVMMTIIAISILSLFISVYASIRIVLFAVRSTFVENYCLGSLFDVISTFVII
jgi:hypothetical protein